jgi:hypothetical protein
VTVRRRTITEAPCGTVSLEVRTDSKVCMRATSRLIGFAARPSLRRGPVSMPVSRALVVPPSLGKASRSKSSFRSVYVLLRAPSLPSPLEDLSVRALPARGFGPLHDLTRLRPPRPRDFRRKATREIPTPRFVPSSGALSLSTVSSALELAGLFRPAAMFRTHPVQGLSLSVQPSRSS